MKNDRTLLLAGLVDEDNFEETRHLAVESYKEQLESDRKVISEQVNFVEEDEKRLLQLIGEEEEEPEWEGAQINENAGIAMGGYGPGFAGRPGYGLGGVSSRYTPSQDEVFGAILGKDYQKSEWSEVSNPKVEIFRKIGNMSPHSFNDTGPRLAEMELPEFDDNFNPILSENEESELATLFLEDERMLEFQEKLNNGEYAVEGGIGPGFSAYDGPKEIKNPFKSNDSSLSKWYMSEGSMDDLSIAPETDQSDFMDSLRSQAKEVLAQSEGGMSFVDLAKALALDLGSDSERKLAHKVIIGLHPEYQISDLEGPAWVEPAMVAEDKGRYLRTKDNLKKARKVLDTTEKRSEERKKELDEEMKEQPDLPGELADIDMASLREPAELFPKEMHLADMSLSLVGKQGDQHVYRVEDDAAMVGVSKDLDGYYSQVRDPIIGLAGEGWGETVEASLQDALQHYSGTTPETPASLNESLEGRTAGNAWSHRRTGAPVDGFGVRFREDGKASMHPDLPEEPSSEGHPGLPGWDFYEGDHTYQKMEAKMDDILDEKEVDATKEVLLKFFSDHSVYQEGLEEEDVLEEMEDLGNLEHTKGMSAGFSIE